MEDVVYTFRTTEHEKRLNEYEANAAALEAQGEDPEGLAFSFLKKHLPLADKSSGIVKFRSVTPKQRFSRSEDQSEQEVLEDIQLAAWRHRELAADHLAAALWISTEAPVGQPVRRKKVSESKFVTIPTDGELVEGDFRTARMAAGIYKGNYATDVVYIGKGEFTGDGRATHTFEVTYYWTEVEK